MSKNDENLPDFVRRVRLAYLKKQISIRDYFNNSSVNDKHLVYKHAVMFFDEIGFTMTQADKVSLTNSFIHPNGIFLLDKFINVLNIGVPDGYLDPDFHHDPLPQPFRRINKILEDDIIDGLWRYLDSKEKLSATFHGPLSAKELHYVQPSTSHRHDEDPLTVIQTNKESKTIIYAHESCKISLFYIDNDAPLSVYTETSNIYKNINWITSCFYDNILYLLIGGNEKGDNNNNNNNNYTSEKHESEKKSIKTVETVDTTPGTVSTATTPSSTNDIQLNTSFSLLCYDVGTNEWINSNIVQLENVNGHIHSYGKYCIITSNKPEYELYKINIKDKNIDFELAYKILPPSSIGRLTIKESKNECEENKEDESPKNGRKTPNKTPKTPKSAKPVKNAKKSPNKKDAETNEVKIPIETYEGREFPVPTIIINSSAFDKQRVEFLIFWKGRNVIYKFDGVDLVNIKSELKDNLPCTSFTELSDNISCYSINDERNKVSFGLESGVILIYDLRLNCIERICESIQNEVSYCYLYKNDHLIGLNKEGRIFQYDLSKTVSSVSLKFWSSHLHGNIINCVGLSEIPIIFLLSDKNELFVLDLEQGGLVGFLLASRSPNYTFCNNSKINCLHELNNNIFVLINNESNNMRISIYQWNDFLCTLYPAIFRGCNQYHNTTIAIRLFKELNISERLSSDYDVSKIINTIDIPAEMKYNLNPGSSRRSSLIGSSRRRSKLSRTSITSSTTNKTTSKLTNELLIPIQVNTPDYKFNLSYYEEKVKISHNSYREDIPCKIRNKYFKSILNI